MCSLIRFYDVLICKMKRREKVKYKDNHYETKVHLLRVLFTGNFAQVSYSF